MKTKLLPVLIALFALPFLSSAQSVVDRLKTLDNQRASGAITEEDYQAQWRDVIADGMREAGVEPGETPRALPVRHNPLDKQWEISFSGSWSKMTAGETDLTTAAANLSLGRFVTRSILVYGSGEYMLADLDGEDLEAWGAGVGVDFHFGDRSTGILPYVGAGASWMNVDLEGVGDDNDFAWDVHAGVRQYVGDRVVIKYQGGYQQFTDFDLDGFAVSVGIGFTF